MNCEKCESECTLCGVDWPFEKDYWQCLQCDAIYFVERIDEE